MAYRVERHCRHCGRELRTGEEMQALTCDECLEDQIEMVKERSSES